MQSPSIVMFDFLISKTLPLFPSTVEVLPAPKNFNCFFINIGKVSPAAELYVPAAMLIVSPAKTSPVAYDMFFHGDNADPSLPLSPETTST